MIGITRKGERKVYDIKPIEKLTLGDWRAMMMHSLPTDFDTTDQIIELVHRTTTIPVKELRRLPIVEMTRLLDAMTGLLGDIKNERESVVVPKSFKIKKVEHIVPQNLESDVTWAQWEDRYYACLKVKSIVARKQWSGCSTWTLCQRCYHSRSTLFFSRKIPD